MWLMKMCKHCKEMYSTIISLITEYKSTLTYKILIWRAQTIFKKIIFVVPWPSSAEMGTHKTFGKKSKDGKASLPETETLGMEFLQLASIS